MMPQLLQVPPLFLPPFRFSNKKKQRRARADWSQYKSPDGTYRCPFSPHKCYHNSSNLAKHCDRKHAGWRPTLKVMAVNNPQDRPGGAPSEDGASTTTFVEIAGGGSLREEQKLSELTRTHMKSGANQFQCIAPKVTVVIPTVPVADLDVSTVELRLPPRAVSANPPPSPGGKMLRNVGSFLTAQMHRLGRPPPEAPSRQGDARKRSHDPDINGSDFRDRASMFSYSTNESDRRSRFDLNASDSRDRRPHGLTIEEMRYLAPPHGDGQVPYYSDTGRREHVMAYQRERAAHFERRASIAPESVLDRPANLPLQCPTGSAPSPYGEHSVFRSASAYEDHARKLSYQRTVSQMGTSNSRVPSHIDVFGQSQFQHPNQHELQHPNQHHHQHHDDFHQNLPDVQTIGLVHDSVHYSRLQRNPEAHKGNSPKMSRDQTDQKTCNTEQARLGRFVAARHGAQESASHTGHPIQSRNVRKNGLKEETKDEAKKPRMASPKDPRESWASEVSESESSSAMEVESRKELRKSDGASSTEYISDDLDSISSQAAIGLALLGSFSNSDAFGSKRESYGPHARDSAEFMKELTEGDRMSDGSMNFGGYFEDREGSYHSQRGSHGVFRGPGSSFGSFCSDRIKYETEHSVVPSTAKRPPPYVTCTDVMDKEDEE